MTQLSAFLFDQLRTLVFAAGLALLTTGAGMIYLPLALILPGAVLLAIPVVGTLLNLSVLRRVKP